MTRDRGSTIPLILGFFLVGLIAVAGSVAAGDAFVGQRDLQSTCDGAATWVAASAIDLSRQVQAGADAVLDPAAIASALEDYRSEDPARQGVSIAVEPDPDGRTVTLVCTRTAPVAFGSFFGFAAGVRHEARSTVRSATR